MLGLGALWWLRIPVQNNQWRTGFGFKCLAESVCPHAPIIAARSQRGIVTAVVIVAATMVAVIAGTDSCAVDSVCIMAADTGATVTAIAYLMLRVCALPLDCSSNSPRSRSNPFGEFLHGSNSVREPFLINESVPGSLALSDMALSR